MVTYFTSPTAFLKHQFSLHGGHFRVRRGFRFFWFYCSDNLDPLFAKPVIDCMRQGGFTSVSQVVHVLGVSEGWISTIMNQMLMSVRQGIPMATQSATPPLLRARKWQAKSIFAHFFWCFRPPGVFMALSSFCWAFLSFIISKVVGCGCGFLWVVLILSFDLLTSLRCRQILKRLTHVWCT